MKREKGEKKKERKKKNWKCEILSKAKKRRKITRKVNNSLHAER